MEALDPFTVVAGGHICLTQANEIGQVKILPVSSHQWHTHTRGCSHTDKDLKSLLSVEIYFQGKCLQRPGKSQDFSRTFSDFFLCK
jgi:hypothetical protein